LGCKSDFDEYDYMSVMELRVRAKQHKQYLLQRQDLLIEKMGSDYGPQVPVTEENIAALSQALAQIRDDSTPVFWDADWATYQFLIKKIKQKGGSLEGLQLQIHDFYPIDYNIPQPILPPILEQEIPPLLKTKQPV
jgi:hypothetical protein